MDREDAIKAIRQGAIAACVSGAMTTLIYVVAKLSKADSDSFLGYYNDHAILFDIVLIFLLAWFIYKKSRVAAIAMFLYFIFAKVYTSIETGEFTGGILSLVFLYFFGRAVWGSFSYHRIEKAENPDYKKGKKWIWFIVIPIATVFVFLLGFGMMTITGFAPSTEVQSGQELHENHLEKLIMAEIVSSRGDVEYFYSEGVLSVLEGGNILTGDEVISYTKNEEDELEVFSIKIEDVTSINVIEEGGTLTDAIYRISDDNAESWVEVWLSVENDGHLKFINALESKMTKEKSEKN